MIVGTGMSDSLALPLEYHGLLPPPCGAQPSSLKVKAFPVVRGGSQSVQGLYVTPGPTDLPGKRRGTHVGTVPFDPGTEGPHSLLIPVETVSDARRCWGAPQHPQVRSPGSFPDSKPQTFLFFL